MERKSRIVFILLTAVVIAAAILASFGPTLFSGGVPQVVLPDLMATPDPGAPDPGQVGDVHLVQVGVTADTVQNVIASLERPVSYTRTMTLETFSGGRQYSAAARVWVDGDWTQVEIQQTQGTQHTIVGGERFYRWYNGDHMAVEGPADRWDADLAQRIPSYQDIIDLDKTTIAETGYVEKDGIPCIYVEVAVDELGYAELYWVSASGGLANSGLLMSSETRKDGEVVLRMTSSAPESPVTAGTAFTLPGGAVLHKAGE